MRGFAAWFVALVVVVAAVPVLPGHAELPPGGTFIDDNGHVFEGDIEAIFAEGITLGCNPPDNNRFCPEGVVTRGAMAAFLSRGLNLVDKLDDPFVDDDGSVFEDDIERLAAAGITLGCNPPDNDRFCPNDSVTREQMAAFLVRGMGYTDNGGGNLFVDDDGSVFEEDIDRLATAGVTLGCNPPDNDRFCPSNPVKRGEMAAFLTRALGLTPMVPPPVPTGGGTLTVMFVAVRQGDATVFVGACGDTGLLDANRYRSAEVLSAIDSVGSRDLKWIASSNYDADHLGAVLDVATASGVTVGEFYDRGGDRTVKDSNTYRDYFDHVTATGNRNPLDIGDSFTLCTGDDEVTFTVVSAGTDGTAVGGVVVTEENDRGLCLHVDYHDFDMAMCGDINGTDDGSRTDVETAVAATFGNVEVVKVNHHGSAFSSNAFYASTLSPEVAIISVGKNGFGHPDPTVIARWDTYGEVFQTQAAADNALVDGNIIVTTSGVTSFTATGSSSGRGYTIPMDENP